ncbi:uncharacterized protein LOC110464719 [Mizuhopecten yessoensis]|uniref:uncharacterized protein LOC110464719 n=1 Tax=Mizuhopecten yessoensis TaxID=6573 RepID=UPI000B45C342|nr:uncharacterized protein LOC110464719 [Mizuhopecten yessoensis]
MARQISKRRRKRRKFNGPRGRHSAYAKKRYQAADASIHQRLRHILNEGKPRPYKICRMTTIVDGQPTLKFFVKRLNPTTTPGLRAVPQRKPGIHIHKVDTFDCDGYRVFHLGNLHKHLLTLMRHASTCGIISAMLDDDHDLLSILGERNVCGLAGELMLRCACGHRFNFESSPVVNLTDDKTHHDVNLRAVWGTMVSGRGASSLGETCATLNLPVIPQRKFSAIESDIGDLWNDCLKEDMIAAAAEERELAVQSGDFHDGVPAITVICDGGWSKRSHKHSYNALGGVGIIFGARTGKILHIGVRNKHCYICALSETRKTTPPSHTCFRNWTESSQAMEADIILDGFLNAEKLYGLRYMRMIADGDSSVFARIQQSVPIWGRHVIKMECSNHVCKCLRSSLEKLVFDKPHYKGSGGLTKMIRVRLTTAVRCAIRMRSKEACKRTATQKLDHDIRNSVHHIFGDHTRCTDFCKFTGVPSSATSTSNLGKDTSMTSSPDENTEDVDHVLHEQQMFWTEGTSDKDIENSRYGCTSVGNVDKDMLSDISVLLDRVAAKSSRLIGNFTTNLAESWMSIRMKFDGGKVFNRCNRGSWHARCYGGALRKNFGPAWSPIIWHRTTGVRPGRSFTSLYRQRSLQLFNSLKSQKKEEVKARKRTKKMASSAQSNSKKAKREYGQSSLDVLDDVPAHVLKTKCEEFLKSSVEVADQQCQHVQLTTQNQSYSVTWKEQRRIRLTASNFGDVFHRNRNKSVIPLVKRLLYSSFCGTQYTRYGLMAEADTIREYIQKKAECDETVSVQKMGLSIDLDHKFLAASCDGKVVLPDGSCGIIEIKNLLQRNKFLFADAAKKMKSFCCENINGSLKLKENHNYYFQVQGQLNVTKLPWCDFIIRRTQPYQMHVERIYRDERLWENKMLPKLSAFYRKCILPEIVLPRHNTSTGIREPQLPWFVPVEQTVVKSVRRTTKVNTTTPTCSVQGNPKCASSKGESEDPVAQTTRRRRRTCTKFVGRRIQHEWCVDEATGETKWYIGTVLEVIKGKDGHPSAIYEILYDGEDEPQQVDNLHEDLNGGSVKFVDL